MLPDEAGDREPSPKRRSRRVATCAALVPVVYAPPILVGIVGDGDSALSFAALIAASSLSAFLVWRMVAMLGDRALLRRALETVALLASGYAVLVVAGSVGGCSSATLPPIVQDATTTAPVLPAGLHVGVEAYAMPAYSDALLRTLEGTGCFARVSPLSECSSAPDLVARVEHPITGAAPIPLVTLLTLGVVPTCGEETTGVDFSLSSPVDSTERVRVTYRFRGTFCLGWVSGLLNVSPDRTDRDVREHPRYLTAVSAEIARNGARIDALRKRDR